MPNVLLVPTILATAAISGAALLAGPTRLADVPAGGPAAPPPLLRALTGQTARETGRDDVSVVRQRAVAVDLGLVGGAWGALPPADRIELALFDDVTYVARLQRIEQGRHGAVWIGVVEGVPLSQVVFAVVGGEVTGSVTMPGRSFDLQPAGGGVHLAREIDDRLRLGDGVIQVGGEAAEDERPAAAGGQAAYDDAVLVDVLVAYTAEVKAKRGGENATLSMIDAAVAEANQAYQNSRIGLRLRLVGTAEVDYPGAGDLAADLSAIRSTSDGKMDGIHGLRNTLGADLVALIVETDPKWCGMAYMIANPSSASAAASGFSVSRRTCMGGYTFAHELGHNMGSQHDWYMTASPGAYRFSHGHIDLDGGFRTIMAYPDLCSDQARSCTRIAYFSNPDVRSGNRPTGVADGTNAGCTVGNPSNPPCDADNARSINGTAQAVAGFRTSLFVGNTVAFPPRNETFAFRTDLEAKYRDDLRRPAGAAYADVEGSVVWVSEYLLYRVHQCDHARAMAKVRMQIQGLGLPSVCGQPPKGTIPFPPRNETYAMRLELEAIYRDELKRQPSQSAVDVEGDVVWTQEYLRYRLNGCGHDQAASRVMIQIDGGGIPPVCR